MGHKINNNPQKRKQFWSRCCSFVQIKIKYGYQLPNPINWSTLKLSRCQFDALAVLSLFLNAIPGEPQQAHVSPAHRLYPSLRSNTRHWVKKQGIVASPHVHLVYPTCPRQQHGLRSQIAICKEIKLLSTYRNVSCITRDSWSVERSVLDPP